MTGFVQPTWSGFGSPAQPDRTVHPHQAVEHEVKRGLPEPVPERPGMEAGSPAARQEPSGVPVTSSSPRRNKALSP